MGVQKPDIAERSMDETWVHPFTSGLDVVLPTANPWTRPYLPYNSNGGNNVYAQREPVAVPVAAQIASKDIANHEVRQMSMSPYTSSSTQLPWVDSESQDQMRLQLSKPGMMDPSQRKHQSQSSSSRHQRKSTRRMSWPRDWLMLLPTSKKAKKPRLRLMMLLSNTTQRIRLSQSREKRRRKRRKRKRKRKKERRRTLPRRRRLRLLKRARRRRKKKKRKKPRKLMLTRRRRRSQRNPSNRSRRLSLRSKRMVTRRKRRKSQLLPQRKSILSSQQFTKIKLTLTPQI